MTLNLSHCLLELGECEQVVQLNDELLKTHKGGETHARTLGMAPKAGGGNIKAAFNVETGARHTCNHKMFFLLCVWVFFFSRLNHRILDFNNNHIHQESKRTPHPPNPCATHPPTHQKSACLHTATFLIRVFTRKRERAQQSQARCRIPFSLPWRPTTDTAVRKKKKKKTRKFFFAVFFLSLPQLNYS